MVQIRPLVAVTITTTLCGLSATGCAFGSGSDVQASPVASKATSPADTGPSTSETTPETELTPGTEPTRTSAASPAPSTSRPAPATPRPPGPPRSPSPRRTTAFYSPIGAIEYLVQARRRDDRVDALRAASAATVNYVWNFPTSSLLPPQHDCRPTPSRSYDYHCFFYYEGGGLNYYLNGNTSSGFWIVRALFVAD